LQVTATIETLKGLAGAAGAEMEFSLPISSAAVQRMACDCSVTRVLLNQESVTIDVGRSKRVISGAARKALMGLPFAEAVGGAGGDFLSLCIAIEEISRADAGVGITLEAAVCLGSSPIYEFGTPAQKEHWLPDLVAGRKLWAFGLTEPEAGSDACATKTRAESRDGMWVINGAERC